MNYLTSIYERIRAEEFRPDSDHVTQVAKFEQTLIGKRPELTAPHRRLVCYCRLYEIYDLSKRERLTAHQREVFLFNDLLVVSSRSFQGYSQDCGTIFRSRRSRGKNGNNFNISFGMHFVCQE